jgi:hypothetical protein
MCVAHIHFSNHRYLQALEIYDKIMKEQPYVIYFIQPRFLINIYNTCIFLSSESIMLFVFFMPIVIINWNIMISHKITSISLLFFFLFFLLRIYYLFLYVVFIVYIYVLFYFLFYADTSIVIPGLPLHSIFLHAFSIIYTRRETNRLKL